MAKEHVKSLCFTFVAKNRRNGCLSQSSNVLDTASIKQTGLEKIEKLFGLINL